MSVLLDTPFATAEDTAAVLGVSKSRLKRLLRLVGPSAEAADQKDLRIYRTRAAKQHRNGTLVTSKRRKQTRGKAKKAAH
jgi:hypothetical protein